MVVCAMGSETARGGSSRTAAESVSALQEVLVTARAAWPAIDLSPAAFEAAVGHAVAGEPDAATAIRSMNAGDLWLATACAAGHRVALAELERLLASLVPTLARMGAGAALIDDVVQVHRTRLLSPAEDRPPRIRGYRGRGDLRSWLKVALVRDMARALRRDRAQAHDDADEEIERLMDPGGDAELAALKDAYRDRFRVAFSHALAELSPRDRNVLRYHLIEALSIDEIGAIHRVHRSTAARWLGKVREQLYEGTCAELMRSLDLGPTELDSVLRLIRSRLDASIARGLDDPTG